MKDHSSENYLDQLLNSVNGEYNDIEDTAEQKPPMKVRLRSIRIFACRRKKPSMRMSAAC